MTDKTPIQFLTVEELIRLYREQVDPGAQDLERLGTLRAVLAMPEARMGGGYSHRDLFEMAAAYLFHLAHNQPFPRGNLKMAGLATLYFLYLHGMELNATPEALADLVRDVANNLASKHTAAEFLRNHARAEAQV